jgi:hypothetical protein
MMEHATYRVVKRVIDAEDPESLLGLGADKDEYMEAAQYITKAIAKEGNGRKLTVTELANIVALSLHICFDMWKRPVTLHVTHFELAKKLLAAITGL